MPTPFEFAYNKTTRRLFEEILSLYPPPPPPPTEPTASLEKKRDYRTPFTHIVTGPQAPADELAIEALSIDATQILPPSYHPRRGDDDD